MKRGDIVADYIIKEICGQGLFKARRIHEESFVTLIELPDNILQDDKSLERFSAIKHANVQEILAAFDIDGKRYLTTPWIEVDSEGMNGVSLDGVGEQWLQQLLSGLIYLKNNRYSLPPAGSQSIIRTKEGKCYISIMALLSQNGKGGNEAGWIQYFVDVLKQLTGGIEKNAYSNALNEIAGTGYESLNQLMTSLENTHRLEVSRYYADLLQHNLEKCALRQQIEDLSRGSESDSDCDKENEELRKKIQQGNEELRKEKSGLLRDVTQLKKALSQEKCVYSNLKMVFALAVGAVCCWWWLGQKASKMGDPINPVEEVKIVKLLCEESGKTMEKLVDYVRELKVMATTKKTDGTSCMRGKLQTELDKANEDLAKVNQALAAANENLKQTKDDFAIAQQKWEEQYKVLSGKHDELQGMYNKSLKILSMLKELTEAQEEDYSDLYTKVSAMIDSKSAKSILTPKKRKSLEKEQEQNKKLLDRINAWNTKRNQIGLTKEDAEKHEQETIELLEYFKLRPYDIEGIDKKKEALIKRQANIEKMLKS